MSESRDQYCPFGHLPENHPLLVRLARAEVRQKKYVTSGDWKSAYRIVDDISYLRMVCADASQVAGLAKTAV
jgi:hypothetical protein